MLLLLSRDHFQEQMNTDSTAGMTVNEEETGEKASRSLVHCGPSRNTMSYQTVVPSNIRSCELSTSYNFSSLIDASLLNIEFINSILTEFHSSVPNFLSLDICTSTQNSPLLSLRQPIKKIHIVNQTSVDHSRICLDEFCSAGKHLLPYQSWINQHECIAKCENEGHLLTLCATKKLPPFFSCEYSSSLHNMVKNVRGTADIIRFILQPEIFSFVKLMCGVNSVELSSKSSDHIVSVTLHAPVSEKQCCCSSPCDVPPSLSIIDAVMEECMCEDTEVLSSGDELDKLESDTDSQDTVIEGEAYKRMRSVAMKEKIIHANEELFGNVIFAEKDALQNEWPNTFSSCKTAHAFVENVRGSVEKKARYCDVALPQKFEKSKNDLLLHSNSAVPYESLGAFDKGSVIVNKRIFPLYGNHSLREPVLNDMKNKVGLMNKIDQLSQDGLNAVSCSLDEAQFYSSESSDNGSDVEEVVLSDTSTSSDEASYISPAAGMYHNLSSSYKLHTIVEESCEESDRNSRGNTPTNVSSDFVYVNNKGLFKKSFKTNRKFRSLAVSQDLIGKNTCVNTDYRNKKGSAVNSFLATSRLENFFRCGSVESKLSSSIDEDLTDESGGVSSDDDDIDMGRPVESRKFNHSCKDVLIHQPLKNASTVVNSDCIKHFTQGMEATGDKHRKPGVCRLQEVRSKKSEINTRNYQALPQQSSVNSLSSFASSTCSNNFIENSMSNCVYQLNANETDRLSACSTNNNLKENNYGNKGRDVDNVSDDEARYIMSHVLDHITNNNNKSDFKMQSEFSSISPALKMLESKITRLMLTVSPVSLSAGEPSSSCSSTIGSNNSDYGSDTLESCEETSTDEESIGSRPNSNAAPSSPLLTCSGQQEMLTANSQEHVYSEAEQKEENCGTADETLYICKQLVASLKKIADSTEASMVSDELSKAEVDDHTAKQYIADQIVSLMQTVSASRNNSPLISRSFVCHLASLNFDVLNCHDRSDSDSPQPNDEKRGSSKSKTPSESGSETTISASISIPSYDDSDRTPTESEISHEMDELYALLESSGCSQEPSNSTKATYDSDVQSFCCSGLPVDSLTSCAPETSLLLGAASKLESLLPISIEERIAMYNNALVNKESATKDDCKSTEMRIKVILPQPFLSVDKTLSDAYRSDMQQECHSSTVKEKYSCLHVDKNEPACNIHSLACKENGVTSVKIISDSAFMPSNSGHALPDCDDYSSVMQFCSMDSSEANAKNQEENLEISNVNFDIAQNEGEKTGIISSLHKGINPKEKASSENDLLIANYRAKCKSDKVFGTKSTGNISELENINNKSTFRDTGYYSFKSSDESFLSLDDSTNSRTSTTSLTQYRSLTSTETIPEEEESNSKAVSPTKISLSSGNIPFEVCDTTASKSSTLPLSLRGKPVMPAGNHRARSSFFSTSGVLRKLTLLRDEGSTSLRSSPHGRMRIRHRTLSGGSEDGRQLKESVPHITVSASTQQTQAGTLSTANFEKDVLGLPDEEVDPVFSYHSRSQMSLSSFGGRSGSVTSVYSAAGGGRYGTVAVTGEVLFSLSYSYKAGTFEVFIKECRNLAAVDSKRNRSDPYVKVYLLPDRTKSGKRKTKVKKHTLSPVFDELLKFQATVSQLDGRTLWLSVWHSDRFGRNDFLGEVMLSLGQDNLEKQDLKWYPLQERLETLETPVSYYKGDLILALKYFPFDITNCKNQKKSEHAKGALHIFIKEARNLMATRSNGTSDPFCKSYLLPDKSKSGKQKTSVLKKTCSPKWNHTFVYEDVSLDELRERCLELTIWDYDKITSNDFLGGVRLSLGSGKHQGRDVDWMDSAREEVSLWSRVLNSPDMWVEGLLLLRPSMQNRRPM